LAQESQESHDGQGQEPKPENLGGAMKTFTCPTCKKNWPENYCPMCARTIDKTIAQQPAPAPSQPKFQQSVRDLPPTSTANRGRNDCPLCDSKHTGKADGKFKAVGFQAFPNRCCYNCDAAWMPACPRWIAVVCIVAGVAAWLLLLLMFTIAGNSGSIGSTIALSFFGWLPVLYGLAVFVGLGGKMKILSKGQNR
jgi:hypothetical protein